MSKVYSKEAEIAVSMLLEADPDDFDLEREVKRLTTYTCPECGSKNTSQPDVEKLVDCHDCGVWFNPFASENKEVRCKWCGGVGEYTPGEDAEDPMNCPDCRGTGVATLYGGRKKRLWRSSRGRTQEALVDPEGEDELKRFAIDKGLPRGSFKNEKRLRTLRNLRAIRADWLLCDDPTSAKYLKSERIPFMVWNPIWRGAGLVAVEAYNNSAGTSYRHVTTVYVPISRLISADIQEAADPDTPEEIKKYAIDKGAPRRVKISYAIITPESAAAGDFAEHGWENEEGVPIELADYELEEDKTYAMACARYLYDQGAMEPSSSTFHPGVWYTQRTTNYPSGEEREQNYHLDGFTEKEEEEVFNLLRE